MAGPKRDPFDTASTSKYPIIGPVHEKETKANVNAIKKMPISPPLFDLESMLLTNREGNVISNAPRNETAKTIIIAKNNKLNKN